MEYPHFVDVSIVLDLWNEKYRRVVYGLIDPRRPNEIAYVGKTKGHVFLRYLEHLEDGCRSEKLRTRYRWLAELRQLGLIPQLCILEVCSGHSSAVFLQREMAAILQYQMRGQAWVNVAHNRKVEACLNLA